ncbi:MAG: Gfo/Idh/MocA family protein [Catenulispora sp.]
MATIRAGIAGAGMVAAVHADAIRRAGGSVVGVAASTAERSKAAAQRLNAVQGYDSAEELAVADAIDVLHVCTPNALHGPLVRAALAAGKHVVCEKPLSLSGADSDELAALAERSGLVAAVPLVYRYHPMTVEARARVRRGDLGAIRLIHGHYLQDWLARPEDNNWRVDPAVGGASRAFADIGSHWCDLVEWITGHRISELTATTQTVLPHRSAAGRETFTSTAEAPGDAGEAGDAAAEIAVTTEDAVHVLFRTDLGATGTLVVSQVSPGRKNRLWFEIDGAERSVSFDGEDPETLLLGGRDRTEIVRRDHLTPEADRINAVPAGHPWGYRDCFAAFTADVYAAIAADPAPTGSATAAFPAFPAFADAARTAHITDAVLASAAHRSWIEVS